MERSLKKMYQLFTSNGHPPTILRRAQKKATQLHNCARVESHNRHQHIQNSMEKTPLVLPFVDDKLCHKIQGIVKHMVICKG